MASIGSLISQRLDTILSQAINTTNAVKQFIEEVRHRRDLIITASPPPDFPNQPLPLPELPTTSPIEDIRSISERDYPNREIPDFDISDYLSQIESLIKDITVSSPSFESVSIPLKTPTASDIPTSLQDFSEPFFDSLPSFLVPDFEPVSEPMQFSIDTEAHSIEDLTYLDTKTLFLQIDDMLNRDLQNQYYLSFLIKKRRQDIDSLVSLLSSIQAVLEEKDALERSRIAREKINNIVDNGFNTYLNPVYSVYISNMPSSLRNKIQKLENQLSNLIDGKVDEQFFSENVFTDKDRKDKLTDLILRLKSELDEHEKLYISTLISLENLRQNYVILYTSRTFMELSQLYEKEFLLISIREAIARIVLQYQQMYKETYTDYYNAILRWAKNILSYISAVIDKNNALWEAYNRQVSILQEAVNQYDTQARTYQSQVDYQQSKVSLSEQMFRFNQIKQELFRTIVRKAVNLYNLRREKIEAMISNAEASIDTERILQEFDISKISALQSLQRAEASLQETDIARYREEFRKWLDDILTDYRAKVQANSIRTRLLHEAYNTFVRKALRHASYMRNAQSVLDNFAERVSMIAFNPLAEMANGLHSAIDAIANGMYELITEL